jgi:hypothetical protein
MRCSIEVRAAMREDFHKLKGVIQRRGAKRLA